MDEMDIKKYFEELGAKGGAASARARAGKTDYKALSQKAVISRAEKRNKNKTQVADVQDSPDKGRNS